METLNCPKCKRSQNFTMNGKQQHVCDSCHSTYKMCKIENCTSLIKTGVVCKKCIGKGLNKGGSLALVGAVAIGGFVVKRIIR